MAQPNVLREYLVSLGFSVDQSKLRTFSDALKGTATATSKLGAEAVAAGVAIGVMVDQVARHFEDLYYMSQRTGSTVKSLDAVSFAAQQVGVSADEARGAVESFATALRHNPGLRGMLGGLGVGGQGDPEAQLRGLVKRLSSLPEFVQVQYAQMFGINEKVFLNYRNNLALLEQSEDEQRARMKNAGLDADEEARKFTELTRVLNSMGASFSVVGARIAHDWRDAVQSVAAWTTHLLDRFAAADDASKGQLGTLAGGVAGVGASAGIGAIMTKLLGAGWGGAKGGGIGAAVAALMTMRHDTETEDQPLRTALRQLFGIADPHEAATPWPAGGSSFPVNMLPAWPGGGAAFDTAPPVSGTRSGGPVAGSSKVWGDAEATAAGLYEGVPLPRPRPSGANIKVDQTNNFGDVRDIELTLQRINDANRGMEDALRNLGQKYR